MIQFNTISKFISCLIIAFLLGCTGSKKVVNSPETATPSVTRIAFYNVENLFDTVDDPANTGDDEFLPASKKSWTPERYQTKLDHLAKVVEGMAYPALIGMAEVENAAVLKDFCEKTSLNALGYDFVHFESPDFRGIDVALIYQKSQFTVNESKHIKVVFPKGMIPDKPDYTTRDLLVVEGVFLGKHYTHVIVAHLPSRSDGMKETEARRMHVAELMKKEVDAILSKSPKANIIIMGDMNDEPSNASMTQSLGILPSDKFVSNHLYNCFSKQEQDGLGSYRYKGDWNMLDQIIVSGNVFYSSKENNSIEAHIFQAPWMLYSDTKYGDSPNRTYGGDRYFGGYSDHLPVYIDLEW